MSAISKVGFIGMGLMGVPMSLRLLDAGFQVYIWNRNTSKTQPVVDQGGIHCDSIKELVTAVDTVCLCVTDTDAVENIVFDTDDAIYHSITAQHQLIDFSSIAPASTMNFSQRLYDMTSCPWIDAPVSGGVVGAQKGTLSIMAGGPANAIDQVMPVLNAVSARVTHMGGTGSGQATKVCNQMIVSCNVMVMAEAIAVAKAAGVDAEKIPTALRGGFADSTPLQITGTRMATMDFDALQWHVKTLLKDLTLADTLASQNEQDAPMSRLAQSLMQQHADNGYADSDPCTLISMYLKSQKP